MTAQSGRTHVALSADAVDLADDTLVGQAGPWGADYLADKFVAGYAFEIHIAFTNFQISGTDAGKENLNQGFALAGYGNGIVVDEFELSVFKDGGLHPLRFTGS